MKVVIFDEFDTEHFVINVVLLVYQLLKEKHHIGNYHAHTNWELTATVEVCKVLFANVVAEFLCTAPRWIQMAMEGSDRPMRGTFYKILHLVDAHRAAVRVLLAVQYLLSSTSMIRNVDAKVWHKLSIY